ncbi:MAG: hypothetical protein ACRDIA_07890 [Actinomycetota bacterium]
MKARSVFAAATALIMVLGAASAIAWACTGQSQVQIIPTVVPPNRRTAVTQVAGRPFNPGAVVVRWNALDGPELARTTLAEGRELALEFTVPDAAPGVYYVVVAGSDGQEVARAALEVTSAAGGSRGANAASDLWGGFNQASSPAGDDLVGAAGRETGSGGAAGYALIAAGLASAAALTFVALGRGRSRRHRTE